MITIYFAYRYSLIILLTLPIHQTLLYQSLVLLVHNPLGLDQMYLAAVVLL